jgi:hypothetical protein
MVSVPERTIPTEQPPLVSEVSANFFVDRGCSMISAMNLYSHVLSFVDRNIQYMYMQMHLSSKFTLFEVTYRETLNGGNLTFKLLTWDTLHIGFIVIYIT